MRWYQLLCEMFHNISIRTKKLELHSVIVFNQHFATRRTIGNYYGNIMREAIRRIVQSLVITVIYLFATPHRL